VKSIFVDSRSAKYAILTNAEALNFDLYEFWHFLKQKLMKLTKFRAPKIAKMAVLKLL